MNINAVLAGIISAGVMSWLSGSVLVGIVTGIATGCLMITRQAR